MELLKNVVYFLEGLSKVSEKILMFMVGVMESIHNFFNRLFSNVVDFANTFNQTQLVVIALVIMMLSWFLLIFFLGVANKKTTE